MSKKEKKSKKKSAEAIQKKLQKLEKDIASSRKKMVKLLSRQAKMDVQDYTLKDKSGTDIMLSQLFGDKNDLVLVHNMGKSCPYCTLWADGFSGASYFIEKKTAFALVSPDEPAVHKEFAESRGWKFPSYSAAGTTFIKDMGYLTEDGGYWPGVSVFHKDEAGKITRVAKDFFGPGDFYSAPWHFFELVPSLRKQNEEGED
jgi:predicted dithiol-disulfide oxidoreductase (DUF899 family)